MLRGVDDDVSCVTKAKSAKKVVVYVLHIQRTNTIFYSINPIEVWNS